MRFSIMPIQCFCKWCIAVLQAKMVSDRRSSVSRAGAANTDSPFREARGMSQQSSSELDKSLMQVQLSSCRTCKALCHVHKQHFENAFWSSQSFSLSHIVISQYGSQWCLSDMVQ